MALVRTLLRHPLVVALLLLGTLAVRVLVPAGYMPVASGASVSLQPCPGSVTVVATPMGGMHHDRGGRHETPAKADQPCAFAGLAAPALGSADPVLLVAALLFAFALALRGAALFLPGRAARLRPPLRGPPLLA